MEDMGMTDTQFKDFLRGLISDLEEVKERGVSEEAAIKLERLLDRFQASLED